MSTAIMPEQLHLNVSNETTTPPAPAPRAFKHVHRRSAGDGLVVLTFDRQDSAANIFDRATLEELNTHLEALEREEARHRVVQGRSRRHRMQLQRPSEAVDLPERPEDGGQRVGPEGAEEQLVDAGLLGLFGGAPAQATASPSAPKTGNAGLAGDAGTAAVAATLAVLAVGVVAGGRVLASRRG